MEKQRLVWCKEYTNGISLLISQLIAGGIGFTLEHDARYPGYVDILVPTDQFKKALEIAGYDPQ